MSFCLKNGFLVDPAAGRSGKLDLIIEDGAVAQVGADLDPTDCQVFDLEGLYVLPGLVDVHTHLREPGEEEKETIATGARAAAKGGFTSVAAMPNTKPPADQSTVINYVLSKAQAEAVVHVYPVGNITKGGKGEEMAELGELAAAGAVAFSDDGASVMNAETQRAAFEYGKLFDKVFLLHCEDANLARDGSMHEGAVSTRLGLKGIPALAEEIIVARDLQLAEATGAHIHICHVSTKRSVELIQEAKLRGVKVTAEATPHHLSLIDEDVIGFNTATKVNPPLRSRTDREALRRGVMDGTINLIATDHAPHTREEKLKEYPLAPCGMIGLETALGIILTEFYHTGLLDLLAIVELMSLRPARLLKISGGTLAPGTPADLIVVDPNLKWEVRAEDFASKSCNSPFIGKELTGKNLATMVDGRWVYFDLPPERARS
ncbi:MAG TPA: dihydroorotase [Firmicutes bacterium]|nr:dihydroorotase [Bacillota bacterium]